ncbi:TPA: zinc-ribbon domain-containing protein [Streptococcus suis]
MEVVKDIPELLKYWNFEKNLQFEIDPKNLLTSNRRKYYWACPTCKLEWHGTVKIATERFKEYDTACKNCIRDNNSVLSILPEILNYIDFNAEDINTIETLLRETLMNAKRVFQYKCPTCRLCWKDYVNSLKLEVKEDGTLCHIDCNENLQKLRYRDVYPSLESIYHVDNNINFDDLTLLENITIHRKWQCNKCEVKFSLSIDKLLNRISRTGSYCIQCNATFDSLLPKTKDNSPLTFLQKEHLDEWSKSNIIQSNQVDALTNVGVIWNCNNCKGEYNCSPIEKLNTPCPYCDNKQMLKGFNTLLEKFPQFEVFWDDKNPNTFGDYWQYSKETLSWICPCCNISFLSSPAAIVARINPKGFNNLTCPNFCDWSSFIFKSMVFSEKPIMLQEWSPKNEIAPEKALHHIETKKYIWNCSNCHGEYMSSIPIRKEVEVACPYCRMEKLKPDFNSIGQMYPEIAAYWGSTNEKSPFDYLPSKSNRTQCYIVCPECTLEYQLSLRGLLDAYNYYGLKGLSKICLFCTQKLPIPGVNSLDILKPYLIEEWSSNNKKEMGEYFATSNQIVEWSCRNCKNRYKACINERYEKDNACPYCTGAEILRGFNDLQTLYPHLEKEWSAKNKLKCTEYLPTSNYKAIWNCNECKNEYKANICNRIRPNFECPFCSGKIILPLVDTEHNLLKEWDYLNNILLADPKTLTKRSKIKVWWICKNNEEHRYMFPINKRILYEHRNKETCSICKGLRRKREHFIQYKK